MIVTTTENIQGYEVETLDIVFGNTVRAKHVGKDIMAGLKSIETIDNLSDTREKILIVDDELDALLPLNRALEAENYQVIEASSGMEAIEKTRSVHPDIILLDLMMPEMDGFEVCNVLKADSLTQHIPIIMLTAKREIDDKIKGIEIGADDYVTKPFVLSELKARIKMILRRTNI